MPKRTPLYEIHKSLGARMVEFSGWDMPVQYSGIKEEHFAVRKKVGLFDISHMGEIRLRGADALQTAQYLSCNDLARLKDGQCQYTALLTELGTFVDDIIAYPLSADDVFICANASNTNKDFDWINSHLIGQATAHNESDDWCQLAVQGPQAENLLQKLTSIPLNDMKRFSYQKVCIADVNTLLSRTGYTGEDGFEIYASAESAPVLWNQLYEAGQAFGLLPCGLGARDTLRLEAAYPLYGHEIDDKTNPFEAGLAWIVKMDQGDFMGKEALQRALDEDTMRQVIGFTMDDKSIARQNYEIFCEGVKIGTVASGTFSPTLGLGIGTGIISPQDDLNQQKIEIDIRGKKRKATVVSLPFYRAPKTAKRDLASRQRF